MRRPTRSASRGCVVGERRARGGIGLADRAAGDRRDDGVDDRRQLREPADAGLARGERPRLRLDDRVAERVAQAARRSRRSRDASTCRRPSPARRRPARSSRGAAAVTTSPARPLAIAASQCAVAGATTIASAESATTMWPIRPSGSRSSTSVSTGWRDSAANDSGPTKRVADGESSDDDVGALGGQEPEQLDRLVRRDRAGDAERDEPARRARPRSAGARDHAGRAGAAGRPRPRRGGSRGP